MALLCLAVSLWGFCWLWFIFVSDFNIALFATRLLNFFAVFIPIFYLNWILRLLEIEKQKISKLVLIIGYLITLFFATFSFSDYFIYIRSDIYFNYYAISRILHLFYLILCYFGLVGFALYYLAKYYKQSNGYRRSQIRYVFIGSLIGFGGGATNYFLFFNIPIPPIGNPLIAIGYGFFAYAIIRYRLMDIKVVLGKSVAYILSAITIIGSAFLLIYFNNHLANPLPIAIVAPFIALLSVLLLQVHKFYVKLAEHYFYRNFYETKIAISDLEERLMQVLDLKILSSLILNTLTNIFSLNKIAVIAKNTKTGTYTVQESINFKEKELNSLIKDKKFAFCLKNKKLNMTKRDSQYLKNLGIEILLPLIYGKEAIGVIILGSKYSGEDFSTHDLKILFFFC